MTKKQMIAELEHLMVAANNEFERWGRVEEQAKAAGEKLRDVDAFNYGMTYGKACAYERAWKMLHDNM